jgi:hypothetical protein
VGLRAFATRRRLRPMDRDAHRRFLAYLETFPYFNSPTKQKLTREAWLEYDAELRALKALGRELEPEQERRRRALATVLLVD